MAELTVGQRLKELRRLHERRIGRKFTQDDLAEAIGYAKGTIAKWETDAQTPGVESVNKLALFYGVETSAIWGEKEGVRGGGEIDYMDTTELNLPDTSFLFPKAQALFDQAIGSYLRRGWTFETVEDAAVILLGYFKRTSTLQSSGYELPELSEDLQVKILEESMEEIEYVFRKRGGG